MATPGLALVILALILCPGNCRFLTEPLSLINHLTLDTCSECTQIVQLSANMISSRDAKVMVFETLHALCQRFTRAQASQCDSQVQAYLPKVLHQTSGHLKPVETCVVFGLCAAQKEEERLELPQHVSDKVISSSYERFSPVCSLCLFVIKKLETLLPQNMTEETLLKLMGEVCDLLPQSYKDECDDFISKYGVQIVEFLMSSAAPHTICTLLHLCMFEEQLPPEGFHPSDCESCRTLAVLSRLHLGPNSTEPQTSSFLQSVCVHHPNAIPKCHAFTKVYSSRLQKVLGKQMEGPHACERADLCVALKGREQPEKHRCTGGPYC